MSAPIPDSELARLLPGSWKVAATNSPQWLNGDRVDPMVSYDLVSESPLRLKNIVSFSTDAGEPKTIVGVDTAHGGRFTWRGRGLSRLFGNRWAVTGTNEKGTVLAIAFDKSIVSPAGIDIVVREGVSEPEVRSLVAGNARRFGLSLEDFATLYWFGDVGRA